MSYQVLARKWRPKSFDQLVGQASVVQALVNGLDNDRVHHGFLFTGTRGVGKTTIARIFAKCLNCEQGMTSSPCGECSACVAIDEGRFQDLLEIDAASHTGVDNMRELNDSAHFMPVSGRFKVYLIDEVHMLSGASFNALLKTLEEPPPHVKFILATTDPQKIPVTVLSRCLKFNLRHLLPEQISGQLTHILETEDIEFEAAAIDRIARAAAGSMRDALSLLDQAIAHGGGAVRDDDVALMMGSVDHDHVARIIGALADADAAALLDVVAELSTQSRDLKSVLNHLAEALHRIGLVQLVPKYRDPDRADWDSIAALAPRLSPEDVQLFYQVAIEGARDIDAAPDARTGLEMALLRMLAFRPVDVDDVARSGGSAPPAATRQGAPGGVAEPRPAAPVEAQPRPAAKAATVAEEPSPVTTAKNEPRQDPEAREWHRLFERLELRGAVRELARNIQLDSRNGAAWRFLIPDTVEHLGTGSLVGQLQSAMSSQLGHEVDLSLETSTGAVLTPAAVDEQATIRRRSEAEKAIADDPTVQALKARFGATIVEDTIQPLQ
ncbi:DNA polymerase III subunit gamma/tau [Marinihelvus fidelis]|uniref:DNA polymerase III subunit gamma/tau n=1 Tax=Marinihelvus fidelis TaxID=2613842 RepID=A0A5N0TIR4_9GAMM|nr:DNA polymerase III subunit gamma/tau [Marinihelvus fidelis]KAA9133179.1 DNA polymerase III subunit gamma/tau [Marinihelvus fidelis]